MPSLKSLLGRGTVLIFDGGFGTLLQGRGLKPGQSPELFGLHNPDVIRSVHREYLQAGVDFLTTNTFGGSAPKLADQAEVVAFNRTMASLAREIAQDKACVAGSVGPTGLMPEPMGETTLRELVAYFTAQISGLVQGGVDLILAETHYDLAEARAVVLAAREVCDLPVGVSMTFDEGGSLTGTAPLVFVDTMQNLGVELVATNCSAGPEQLLSVVRAMQDRLATPLLVQPNAGLPELENGRTVFSLGPREFAERTAAFVDLGARCLGGCCGTTPEHIRQLRGAVQQREPRALPARENLPLVLTSRSVSLPLGWPHPLAVIGERINPTGKKQLSRELEQGLLAEALRLAREQVAAGAPVLDVNVGAAMVDEERQLPRLVRELIRRIDCPLSLDSNNVAALQAALEVCPGSSLINSISGEPGRLEELGPLCKRHGAPFILLPLEGSKLPVTAADRLKIIESLLRQVEELGIPRSLVMVDALALTVSSKPEAALACLETIRVCREQWGLPTVLGLSNISFGLPARNLLNTTFLVMAAAAGLSACIANPNTARLGEVLASTEVLLGRDPQARRFIENFSDWSEDPSRTARPTVRSKLPDSTASPLQQAVVLGEQETVLELIEKDLAGGREPFELINEELIPGIVTVGDKYERREFFLPQLLLAAETVQAGFARLRPLLQASGDERDGVKVVMATVQGDIHDIGKNIVSLMLRNHGFEVIDLGKDVPAEVIVDRAEAEQAGLIGLSALMTTTMVRMQETVDLVKERGLAAKVMVGGAVVTEAFASSIGAHGHAGDAVAAVRLARHLLKDNLTR
ncbi:MAG: homocysteine S-methyltransferase family protein [Desulfohalobiaceae bacterium]